jgi:ketosteroid isomerase-like protein
MTASAPVDFATWRAINEALQAYADALDRADLDALMALFAPDAIWDYRPGEPLVGHATIRGFFAHADIFARTSHHVGPPVVRAGARAGEYDCVTYFIATHLLHDGSAYTVYGRYVDRFAGVKLRIAHRRVLAHVTAGTDKAYTFLERITA